MAAVWILTFKVYFAIKSYMLHMLCNTRNIYVTLILFKDKIFAGILLVQTKSWKAGSH